MSRWMVTAWLALTALSCASAEEGPLLPEQGEGLEIEPPVLIKSRDHDGLPNIPGTPQQADLAKLEKDLARAKRNAASGESLFKAGIIAKVEAEERVLRVVRLEAQLADARLEAAKNKASEEEKEATSANELAQAKQEAERTSAERHRAELEAALRNLQRQQKLLALGSGRKADVNRAEKKLADLQSGQN